MDQNNLWAYCKDLRQIFDLLKVGQELSKID